MKLLQEEEDIQPQFRTAILQIVLALAVSEVFQLAFRGANGLPSVVKILGDSKDQVNRREMRAGRVRVRGLVHDFVPIDVNGRSE